MSEDQLPLPEPRGALVPPPRYPPTAVALVTPPPPPRFEKIRSRPAWRRALHVCLNALDHLADGVAHALRVR